MLKHILLFISCKLLDETSLKRYEYIFLISFFHLIGHNFEAEFFTDLFNNYYHINLLLLELCLNSRLQFVQTFRKILEKVGY
jgi:hypothetical protein